jgi:hypothetical protein
VSELFVICKPFLPLRYVHQLAGIDVITAISFIARLRLGEELIPSSKKNMVGVWVDRRAVAFDHLMAK